MVDLNELLKGTVDDVTAKLGDIQANDLATLHKLESKGQNRTTMLAAIDAETKGRETPLVTGKTYTQDEVNALVAEKDKRIAELESLGAVKAPAAPTDPLKLPEKGMADAALLALKGETAIVFVDDQDIAIPDLPELTFWPPDFEPNGDHALLQREIEFPIDRTHREVSAAFLMVDGKPVARAALVQPFATGGGRPSKLPGRTLSFATS
jgi:hypothetical protein